MSRLLLLDGHSLAYRAFFALPAENFSTTTGQTTNAVYGFTSMLINVLRDEEPTHVAVAFDVSRQTFRSEEYTEYKAGRSATPTEFSGQIPLIREVLTALRVPWVELPGYEADDLIATLTTTAEAAGMEVLICSGDRDALQLVTPQVTLLYPRKGVSDLARMTPDAVREKYGVGPDRYSDLAALVGETSDNLPGVPGVGPKTAAKWIDKYGDLPGIVDHVTDITGKAGESLRTHLDKVLLNRRLNALVRDLDLPLTLEDAERHTWDREEVHRVFDGLEFRVLRERLFEYLEAPQAEAEDGFELDGTVLTGGDDVADWLATHAPAGGDLQAATGLHIVPAGASTGVRSEAIGLGLAAPDAAAYLDLLELTPEGEQALAAWLADPAAGLVLHEAKPALHALRARGLEVAGILSDTALAAYLVRPDQRSYDLADLVVRHLHRELRWEDATDATAEATGQGSLLDVADVADVAEEAEAAQQALLARARSAMVHASAVRDLAQVLGDELTRTGGAPLLRDLELPLVPVLADMEATGIAVDVPALEAREQEFADAVAQAQRDAWDAVGDDTINLGSPKQLQVVLFETLGLPKTRRTKTGYTTDADALAGLYERTGHAFLEGLLRHRDAARLRVTVEGLLKAVADDGRIHTTYQQTIAATGRLSSTDPNLQNIPIRTEEGRRIREAFVVGEGFDTLLSADYSQIEMRIMAHLSGDEGLIEAFRSGEDLHRFVGSRVFGVPPEEVTAAMRSKVKAMSYGLAYGLSAFGLSRQLAIPTDEARGLMEEYFERFGGVRDYLAAVVDVARKEGYTETMLGRRRYLPDLTSDNRQRREMAERMALNAPIQGSAADIIKVAMLRVDAALREAGARSRVLLQVHDELVLEVSDDERADIERLVAEQMSGAVELSVPLDVSLGWGRSWHAAAH